MMEQPKVYNTEEELIKWLKYDLKEQRRETAELEEAILGEKIPLKKVEERYLTLNIGMKAENISDDYIEYIEINFEFNLNDIIYKLFDKLSYEDIGYYINCNGLIFNSEANFSNASFKNKVFLWVVNLLEMQIFLGLYSTMKLILLEVNSLVAQIFIILHLIIK
ncbi:hypothetical protein [Brachyspira sp.]|uniref:hypothetical protein n=1 Tax=Brachyspira sp. TaxID=1977261 RepID=UPI003D7C5DB0